jgi:hypothetical protein
MVNVKHTFLSAVEIATDTHILEIQNPIIRVRRVEYGSILLLVSLLMDKKKKERKSDPASLRKWDMGLGV